MEIRPVDLEALGQEKKRWDLSNSVSVLSDLISRQRGCDIKIVLVPKDDR